MLMVRLMKWNHHFTKAEHMDVDISEFAMWEPPGGGWFVAAISTTDKGLPPWQDGSDTAFETMVGPGVLGVQEPGEVHLWRYHWKCGASRVIERNYTPKNDGYSMMCHQHNRLENIVNVEIAEEHGEGGQNGL